MKISKKFFLVIFFSLFICHQILGNQQANQNEDDAYEDDEPSSSLSLNSATSSTFAEDSSSAATETKGSPFSFPKKPKSDGNPAPKRDIWETLRLVDWSKFWVESILVISLAAYYGLYLLGSSTNEKLAKKWLKGSIEYFTQQFNILGDDRGFFLMRNSASEFVFYATGRAGCNFLFGRLKLYPRHDIFGMLYSLYQPTYDHVEIQVQLPENSFDGVFGIVPRSFANGLRKDRHDINFFTKQSTDPSLPDHLVVLSEHGDITRQVLNSQVASKLKELNDSFEGFIISDQPQVKPDSLPVQINHTLTLRYRFYDPEQLPLLHRFTMFLVDSISSIEFRSDLKTKLAKRREEAYSDLRQEEKERQREELEERLSEKRRKELEKRENLAPAAQRKLEEKEAKKKSKKQQAKMVIRK